MLSANEIIIIGMEMIIIEFKVKKNTFCFVLCAKRNAHNSLNKLAFSFQDGKQI